MRWRALGLTLAVLVALSAARVTTAAPANPAATSVPSSAPGPAWWRISNGAQSTLWVLAVPDAMLMSVKWDDGTLRYRLARARQLLSPELAHPADSPSLPYPISISTIPGQQANPDPGLGAGIWGWATGVQPRSHYPQTDARAKYPLSNQLPKDLVDRVGAWLQGKGETRSQILNEMAVYDVAIWLDLWTWPKGELGNPIVDQAQKLATQSKLPITQMVVRSLWKPSLLDDALPNPGASNMNMFSWTFAVATPPTQLVPPQSVQIDCLRQMLDQAESGLMPGLRQAGMDAWARGDVEHAIKRSGTAQLCLMGKQPSTDARAFEEKQASIYLQGLDTAFTAPGESVALVEFDPLLMPGGILDHYRQLGYDIQQNRGM